MISPLGKPQTTIIFWGSLLALALCVVMRWWYAAAAVLAIEFVLLAFFRDPHRRIPGMKGQVVSPADGRISSIHNLEHFEPFNGPAVCIRTFLSVLDVHVNRSPMHGRVASITHKPGQYLNALRAESAELNESVTLVLHDTVGDTPICAVRQVAGAIARRIVCATSVGDILQRGQRFGLIKFGSTTELYLPHPDRVQIQIRQGQYVYGGTTVLAVSHPIPGKGPATKPTDEAAG